MKNRYKFIIRTIQGVVLHVSDNIFITISDAQQGAHRHLKLSAKNGVAYPKTNTIDVK